VAPFDGQKGGSAGEKIFWLRTVFSKAFIYNTSGRLSRAGSTEAPENATQGWISEFAARNRTTTFMLHR